MSFYKGSILFVWHVMSFISFYKYIKNTLCTGYKQYSWDVADVVFQKRAITIITFNPFTGFWGLYACLCTDSSLLAIKPQPGFYIQHCSLIKRFQDKPQHLLFDNTFIASLQLCALMLLWHPAACLDLS